MSQWVGCTVSILCSNATYQGEIVNATNSHISITKAFCDGIPSKAPIITLLASEIADLKLIKKQNDATSDANCCSTVTIAKPTAKRVNKVAANAGLVSATTQNGSAVWQSPKSQPIDIECKNQRAATDRYPDSGGSGSFKNLTPINSSRREKNRSIKYTKGWRDEACFGSPLDQTCFKDFDFEKNLALFDKQAVYDEINSQKPDVVKLGGEQRRPTKYRHDENIIASIPPTLRQICVPSEVFEYVTDDGLVIPTISRVLRKKLWLAAEQVGLTFERRMELMGRATTEMAVQLLGGAHRLNPQNTHQRPSVAFLVGANQQGAVGVNAARQLASQGVNTLVCSLPNECEFNTRELNLYRMTKNKAIAGLPQGQAHNFDLLIVALFEDGENLKLFSGVAEWIAARKAPILALDPPSVGTPGINAKFSLVPVLPLAHSSNNGKIYLCNLGFPSEIFSRVNIKYQSPFGPKFVIPLYPSET